VISSEIGDRQGEAANFMNLGTRFLSRGEYEKKSYEAKENLDKAIAITVAVLVVICLSSLIFKEQISCRGSD